MKDESTLAYDLAGFNGRITDDTGISEFGDIWPEEAITAVRGEFTTVAPSAGSWIVAKPRIDGRLHQQRDREKGRPWKDRNEQRHGVIFAYEFLEAKQAFRGVILVKHEGLAYADRIKQVLQADTIVLGRSRRAGYGGEGRVEFLHKSPVEYENASSMLSADLEAGSLFKAILTSPYVGRHPVSGQLDPTALERELFQQLNRSVMVERRYWDFEVQGGFNRKWRLSLPQAQAVSAGSVLLLRATDRIPLSTLRAVEHEGIGLRRTEGFGRLIFLQHSEDRHPIRLSFEGAKDTTNGSDIRSEGQQAQLKFLETRIILEAARTELDRIAAIDIAAEVDKDKIPTNSLLARLRTVFRNVQNEESARAALARLATWCTDDDIPEALKKSARDKLDRCTVHQGNLRQWLRKLAQGHGGLGYWDALVEASGNPSTLTGLAAHNYLTGVDVAQSILDNHAAELAVHLINAVLTTLARRNRGGAT
ncbi:MAG TPA: hypothetical protein V6D08_17495 [Candidatus Obscuribacterales bacterium]